MRGQTPLGDPWHDAKTTRTTQEGDHVQTSQTPELDIVVLISWVIGIRIILGEWDWLIISIGIVALGARMAWDARPRRDPGLETLR